MLLMAKGILLPIGTIIVLGLYKLLLEDVRIMGASNKICPNCGRKMKQQFIGLQHCKCGMSWKKDIGFFERTSDMVFALQRRNVGKKVKQVPVIRRKQ